jgi:hypothetical protein
MATITATKQRIRYTMLSVTINTNKAPSTAFEERAYTGELARFIRQVLGRTENWHTLLTVTPAPFEQTVDHIDVAAIGIERGPKNRRIHVHFVVTIQHHGSIDFKYHQRDWQSLVDRNVRYTRGSYVHVDLLNARHLNYSTKNAGTTKEILAEGAQLPLVW